MQHANSPHTEYRVGDAVVYRKTKRSVRPGPRATHIEAERGGDRYTYLVDKFWTVAALTPDGRLIATTRRGKRHLLHPSDPNLRRANWWEKLRWGSKFPDPDADFAAQNGAQSGAVTGRDLDR